MEGEGVMGEEEAADFAARLRQLRAEAGLSQEELARRAGMTLGAVAKLEQGLRQPAWPTLRALCQGLGVGLQAFDDSRPAPPARSAWDRVHDLARDLARALEEARREGTPPPPEPPAHAGRKKGRR
jgi:transcriptional regulator with XRE-family HTH domain